MRLRADASLRTPPTADLREVAAAFEQKTRAALDRDWEAASPAEWREMTTGVLKDVLETFWSILRVARMEAHMETYREADLPYMTLVRQAWDFLARRSLMEHVRAAYVERPLGGFVPAVEARDIAGAQRFHLGRVLFAKTDLIERLESTGAPRPPRRTGARVSLANMHFGFDMR